MRLVDGMKDEKLGEALLYNFTIGYGEVPMEVYNMVLPLLLNEAVRASLTKKETWEQCMQKAMQEQHDFKRGLIKQMEVLEDVTSKALGMALLNKSLDFQIVHGEMRGKHRESTILPLNEAILLGEYMKDKMVAEILASIGNRGEDMVILDADTLGKDMDTSKLLDFGQLTLIPNIAQGDIGEAIKNASVVITNKKQLGPTELADAKNVKLICVTATGYNNIDIDYCKQRGITVCNVKGYSTNSVVQHTFALLLDLYQKNRYYHDYVASGQYSRNPLFTHFEETFYDLEGKTWGIVGMGAIGQRVAVIASTFGCQVQYYSTSGKNMEQPYPCVDFNTLLQTSDIISIHAPLNAQTENLFNKEAFQTMKASAYLINVGRGKIVNELDLAEALKFGYIAGAGLDVFENEPFSSDHPLLTIDATKIRLTPHIAWASKEARDRLLTEVYLNIDAFLAGTPRNVCP
jgi:lactate dehydrogenase-like 2-hydroxyacid dehydrogenase